MARADVTYGGSYRHPARALPTIRRIGAADLVTALHRGWQDFLAAPTQLIFLCLVYPVIGLFAAAIASGADSLPMLWPLVSGFALVGPLAAIGVYEISRRLEVDSSVSWLDALEVRHSHALVSILLLGAMLFAIFLAWMVAARLIQAATMGDIPAVPVADYIRFVLNSPEGHRMILWGNLTGFCFAVVVLALTVVSFPMLLDRNPGLSVALRTSIRVVIANPGTMALWGVIVAGLLLLGSLPAFVGLAVVMPVLGHATWHLYRAVVM